jgi:hypothetical protein
MRPQLKYGGDYMQQKVNKQTQFYQIWLAEQPNTKALHMFMLA